MSVGNRRTEEPNNGLGRDLIPSLTIVWCTRALYKKPPIHHAEPPECRNFRVESPTSPSPVLSNGDDHGKLLSRLGIRRLYGSTKFRARCCGSENLHPHPAAVFTFCRGNGFHPHGDVLNELVTGFKRPDRLVLVSHPEQQRLSVPLHLGGDDQAFSVAKKVVNRRSFHSRRIRYRVNAHCGLATLVEQVDGCRQESVPGGWTIVHRPNPRR
jgi:hypothetical protein